MSVTSVNVSKRTSLGIHYLRVYQVGCLGFYLFLKIYNYLFHDGVVLH